MPSSSAHAATPPVFQAAAALLTRCEDFIRLIPDDAYRAPSSVIRGGTIGKHLRHTLDHFAAALVAFETGEIIDYDHRERGVSEETDRRAAALQIADLRRQIVTLNAQAVHAPVTVRVMLSADGREADLVSSLGRELAFATHHAVHHQAMIKAIAAELGITCDDEFGKAPSTVSFEASPRA